MTSLSNHQKQLIFDYCVGICSEIQAAQACELISSNKQASELYSALKSNFAPLDVLEDDFCPDYLAESTISRLKDSAVSSQAKLTELLADEQKQKVTVPSRFWRNLGELAAVAAIILFAASVWTTPLRHLRQKSWQQLCQAQLRRIGLGINEYRNDHDGQLPSVAVAAGSPWWKVGYSGKENYSNTRHMWLLAKGGYIEPVAFVCPGRRDGKAVAFDPAQAKNYNDFPSRKYVTYSFRIKCYKPRQGLMGSSKALIADLNPLFENLPRNYSSPLNLTLSSSLLKLNSSNHNRRGQNVLFADSSVQFKKKRQIGVAGDDIFTLKDTLEYKGVELPSCETDAFLAP